MEDMRIVERLDGKEWVQVAMKDLVHQDIFRMFESTGEVVKDPKGNTQWMVKGDPELVQEGVWGVHIYGEEDFEE